MRRILIAVAALALVAAACNDQSSTVTGATTSATGTTTSSAPPATAADCATTAGFKEAGRLTIGTDSPAYPPYFSGGETKEHDFKFNDPYNGKGFESATAYEVAARMGLTPDQVDWTLAPFNQTYKPGATNYDFAIEQISYSAKRAEAVDFSESYYDVNQALVAVEDTPITSAASIADLANYTLAAPIGTTSYDYIVATIAPSKEPGAYNTLADTVAAINAGQVDGIVVDLPTALFLADPFVQEVKHSVVFGQFATAAAGEYFGMTAEKGSTVIPCVNLALQEMKADGTLAAITQEWLSEKTNVGEVPTLG